IEVVVSFVALHALELIYRARPKRFAWKRASLQITGREFFPDSDGALLVLIRTLMVGGIFVSQRHAAVPKRMCAGSFSRKRAGTMLPDRVLLHRISRHFWTILDHPFHLLLSKLEIRLR